MKEITLLRNDIYVTKDLWPKILCYIDEPQVILVCKLFKKILSKKENIYTFLLNKPRFKTLFTENMTLEQKLTLAKTTIMNPCLPYAEKTLNAVKKYEILPYQGFIRILQEESAINLVKVFSTIPFKKELKSPHILKKAEEARIFLKENQEKVASLEILDLQGLDITQVPEELNVFTGLKEINLRGNKISSLSSSFGKSWKKLEKCDLSFNQLKDVPENLGEEWGSLQILNLNSNSLNTIPKKWGTFWIELRELFLNFNKLEKLPADFGDSWTNLSNLEIDNNQLKLFHVNLVWHNLSFLRIKKNPIPQEMIQNHSKKRIFVS